MLYQEKSCGHYYTYHCVIAKHVCHMTKFKGFNSGKDLYYTVAVSGAK